MFWFWLILPVVAFTSSIHALANLIDSLRTPHAAPGTSPAAAVGSGE